MLGCPRRNYQNQAETEQFAVRLRPASGARQEPQEAVTRVRFRRTLSAPTKATHREARSQTVAVSQHCTCLASFSCFMKKRSARAGRWSRDPHRRLRQVRAGQVHAVFLPWRTVAQTLGTRRQLGVFSLSLYHLCRTVEPLTTTYG